MSTTPDFITHITPKIQFCGVNGQMQPGIERQQTFSQNWGGTSGNSAAGGCPASEVPLRSINAPALRYGALPAHCRGRQAPSAGHPPAA